MALRVCSCLPIAALALGLGCDGGISGPKEEPLTLRILASHAASFDPIPDPEIELVGNRFLLRYSVGEPNRAWTSRAVLLRIRPDSLVIEIRSTENGSGSDLVWHKDYEVESSGMTPGLYRLSWWHILEGTSFKYHVLDTTIVIPQP